MSTWRQLNDVAAAAAAQAHQRGPHLRTVAVQRPDQAGSGLRRCHHSAVQLGCEQVEEDLLASQAKAEAAVARCGGVGRSRRNGEPAAAARAAVARDAA